MFQDSGTENWQKNWMLDGTRAEVLNTAAGFELRAGAEHLNDTCHTVLWTQKSFTGNIAISYDYTRTDTTTRCVNILYFHAQGKGTEEYPKDISMWNDKRKVPHMRTYFNTMETYHISYAAFNAKEYSGENDYIRLRRYNPNDGGLSGTDIPGDHYNTGLFKPFVTYHIEVYFDNGRIEMRVADTLKANDTIICKWDVSNYRLYNEGRIGLRHMYTRNARYSDFKVWQLE
ncbi:MAG: DUF1961 family protein [Leeuwenhoekiella sp.]